MMGGAERARANIYRRLVATERSGVPLVTSLARIGEGGGGEVVAPVLERLRAGEDAAQAFASAPGFSRFESAVIASGAKAGALPESFEALCDYFEQRAQLKRQLLGGMAYPVFLAHAAVFLPSLPVLVTGGLPDFLLATLVPLAVAWGALLGGVFLLRAARRAHPLAVDRALLGLPAIGPFLLRRSLGTTLRGLAILYGNGVPLLEALETAAAASPNEEVGAMLRRVRERVHQGQDPAAAFEAEPRLPGTVVDLIATGATTGRLDDMLEGASRQLDADAKQAQTVLVAVLSGAVFLGAAGLVAYRVISFYADYFGKLGAF